MIMTGRFDAHGEEGGLMEGGVPMLSVELQKKLPMLHVSVAKKWIYIYLSYIRMISIQWSKERSKGKVDNSK